MYFKLFANWYIDIPLTAFCEKVNSLQQIQMSICDQAYR